MPSHKVSVLSSTKDSIYIQWQSTPDFPHLKDINGYKIFYQAIGSSFKQDKTISRHLNRYDINLLHESTFYNICVQSFLNQTHFFDDTGCVRGSTHTDSLGVAIGSTFGAFLALSFIVLLVFLAKRQQNLHAKKQMVDGGIDSPEVALDEALVHMSDSIYIQLCRQRPDFAERLREINTETQSVAEQGEDAASPTQETSQNDLHMYDVTAADAGNEDPDFLDLDSPSSQVYEADDIREDGLLKPPDVPGVFVRPKLTRTRSVRDSTSDLTDPDPPLHPLDPTVTSGKIPDEPEELRT